MLDTLGRHEVKDEHSILFSGMRVEPSTLKGFYSMKSRHIFLMSAGMLVCGVLCVLLWPVLGRLCPGQVLLTNSSSPAVAVTFIRTTENRLQSNASGMVYCYTTTT